MSTTDEKEIEDKTLSQKNCYFISQKKCLKSFDAVVNLDTIMFIDLLYI
jgi:hypothetical protein